MPISCLVAANWRKQLFAFEFVTRGNSCLLVFRAAPGRTLTPCPLPRLGRRRARVRTRRYLLTVQAARPACTVAVFHHLRADASDWPELKIVRRSTPLLRYPPNVSDLFIIYFQFRSSHLADRETCDRVVVPLLPHRAADGDKRIVRSTFVLLNSDPQCLRPVTLQSGAATCLSTCIVEKLVLRRKGSAPHGKDCVTSIKADIPFHYAMSHLNAHVHHVTLRRLERRLAVSVN
eukprot:scaffold51152_cov61-Phaeocystis_antarctica.AAC.3